MSYKFNRDIWIASAIPIEQKLELAEQLFRSQKKELAHDQRISRLVAQLQHALHLSWQCMTALGIGKSCAACDSTAPRGSCCSRGLENKYDVSLLIANLLFGVNLPRTHVRRESCYFLSPRGCTLTVRNMLCVDYLCPELEAKLGSRAVAAIQTVTAEEVTTTFLLCDQIKKRIHAWQG
ncbi:hypothetical protein [Desulfoferrobacter suflitae]|uniref:hypothetical protein n=1 Tax=Desulfoferrobacter suflitae TaxID=2865782 RepID=UPI0021641361|nr:hypothetical protein [Desulfoferrobacter suflitae]MCK8602099.1 hypothetical protein [Desulfoferrobacter suflitae]